MSMYLKVLNVWETIINQVLEPFLGPCRIDTSNILLVDFFTASLQ